MRGVPLNDQLWRAIVSQGALTEWFGPALARDDRLAMTARHTSQTRLRWIAGSDTARHRASVAAVLGEGIAAQWTDRLAGVAMRAQQHRRGRGGSETDAQLEADAAGPSAAQTATILRLQHSEARRAALAALIAHTCGATDMFDTAGIASCASRSLRTLLDDASSGGGGDEWAQNDTQVRAFCAGLLLGDQSGDMV